MNFRKIVMDHLIGKQHGYCAICGQIFSEIGPPTIDHIIPKKLDGPDKLSNLQAAHQICNLKKRDKILKLEEIKDIDDILQIDNLEGQIHAYRKIKIKEALIKSMGNITLAAGLLKTSFRSLRWYCKKYGISKKVTNF